MSKYYTDCIERLPFAILVEIYQRHFPRFIAVLLVISIKLKNSLGIRPKARSGSRWIPEFDWQPRENMPACALSRWAPQIEELEDLGFSLCGYIKSDTIGQKCEAYSYWIDPHGVVVSQLCWQMHSSIEQTRRSMISYFPQGREMITASLSPDESLLSTVLSPDYITCHCEPETTSIKQLYGIHNNHPEIAEAACLTKDAFLATYREHRIKFMNDVIENGFIRQLTQREVNQLAAVDQGL